MRKLLFTLLLAPLGCSAAPPPEPAPVAPEPAAPPVASAPPVAPEPAPIASAAPAVATAEPPAKGPCPAGMVLIPGGEYVFGLLKEKVTVKSFCLDVNEVTSVEYAACVKGGKCDASFVTACDPSTYEKPGQEKMPMVCVDFKQAESYCSAQNKRLASTEEWEWAARGEGEGRKHPWGAAEPSDQLCWSGKGARPGPCAVGSFPAGDNPQGVHDLLGGTGEWTTSRQDASSSNRIGRGASWKDGDRNMFKADRQGSFKVNYRCGFLGIRCASASPVP